MKMKNEPAAPARRPKTPIFFLFPILNPLGAQALYPCNSVENKWRGHVTVPETDI
jgi:hypothetical protein